MTITWRSLQSQLEEEIKLNNEDDMDEGNFRVKSVETNDQNVRQLTVVATDGSLDRDGERFDTASLRLPLKDGGTVKVTQLSGKDDLDIPAFINHERDITKAIGSVSQAFLNNDGQLEMVINLLDDDDNADKVYKLAKGGHLGNNVSVTLASDNLTSIKNGVVYSAYIPEVSVVWRGSNKHARVVSVKSDERDNEMEKEVVKTPAEVADALTQANEALAAAQEAVNTAMAANESDDESSAPAGADNAGGQSTDQKADDGESAEKVDSPVKEEAKGMNNDQTVKAMAATMNAAKAPRPVVARSSGKSWLKTDEATKAFYVTLKESASEADFKRTWSNILSTKGIDGDDVVPDAVANIYFDVMQKSAGILSFVSQISDKGFAGHAIVINGKGRGHKKGNQKASDNVKNRIRRMYTHMMYQRIDLDAIDVYNSPESANRALRQQLEILNRDIERAIVIGDPEGTDDKDVTLVGNDGIWPIKKDTADDADKYGKLVADHYTPSADQYFDDKVTYAKALLDENSPARVMLITKKSIATKLLTDRDENGRRMVDNGNLADYLGVDVVVTPKWMDDDDENDAYLLLDNGYVLFGQSTPTQKPGFDYDTNKNISLLEMPKGGTLDGAKVAVAIRATNKETS